MDSNKLKTNTTEESKVERQESSQKEEVSKPERQGVSSNIDTPQR